MNTPSPSLPQTPTPMVAPTAAGVLQGLITAFLSVKAGTALGMTPEAATVVAGGVVSAITSVFHRVAQKINWS